jgi:hypothetical protein
MNTAIRIALAGAASLAAFAATPAGAACTWEWLCNGEGSCKLMPVCDSVYEVPPPPPDNSQPPAMPPLSMRPHRVNAQMGTLTCEHIMRQGRSGRWYWNEACFCTDPRKARDPSAPFANIVRCENPFKD